MLRMLYTYANKTKRLAMNQSAVENFLSSLDLTIPMELHFRNALRDAQSYKWNSATLIKIMEGIEEAYLINELKEKK